MIPVKQNPIIRKEQVVPKPRIFPKIFWTFIIFFCILILIIFVRAETLSSKVFGNKISFFKRLENLAFNGGTKLQGEIEGQINILLLGYGGVGHDGPYLTDSMILASINPSTKQILLTSVPRDLKWISPKGNPEKINQAYSDGFIQKYNPDQGGAFATAAVSKVSGLDIPYYAALDFSGFVKAIDRISGVDVNVEQSFTDFTYPNDATNGFLPPQTFKKGLQHMNGARALIFARSRHAEGPEGSDFARSKRQEKIIDAFKTKVKNLGLLSNASAINDLSGILADHFHTNIEPVELLHLAEILKSPTTKTTTQSLDESTNLICQVIENSIFYLTPCDGISQNQIQSFFKDGFNHIDLTAENSSIIIENAGNTTLYNQVAIELKAAGVTVFEVPYRGIALQNSALYEVTSKPATENFIEQTLGIKHQLKPPELVAKSDLVLFVGAGTANSIGTQ